MHLMFSDNSGGVGGQKNNFIFLLSLVGGGLKKTFFFFGAPPPLLNLQDDISVFPLKMVITEKNTGVWAGFSIEKPAQTIP